MECLLHLMSVSPIKLQTWMSQEVLIHMSPLGKVSWKTLNAIITVIPLGPARPHTHSSGNDLIPNMLIAFPKEMSSECLHDYLLLTLFSSNASMSMFIQHSTGSLSCSLQGLAHTLTYPEKPSRCHRSGAMSDGLDCRNVVPKRNDSGTSCDPMCSSCWAVYHSSGLWEQLLLYHPK